MPELGSPHVSKAKGPNLQKIDNLESHHKMKLLKSLVSGAAALACGSLAFAADPAAAINLRLTGATAFRLSVHAAIVQSLDNCQVGYAGTDLGTASQAAFFGTVKNLPGVPAALVGKSALIKTTWNGSAAGIQAVAQTKVDGANQRLNINFLDGATATGNTVGVTVSTTSPQTATYTGTLTGGLVGNGNLAAGVVSQTADVVFADVHQGNTIFAAGTNSYYTSLADYNNGVTHTKTFSSLNETPVGVVVFSWLRTNSADATLAGKLVNFTNIDNWKAQLLLTNGQAPLSFFTGVAADSTYPVFVTGRNADSGTRVTTFAEAGFTAAPWHVKATVTGTSITDVSDWPDDVVQTVYFPSPTSGESSGGTLVTKIKNNVSATATYNGAASNPLTVVTTAGIGDIVAKGGQAFEIKWNGTMYSDEAVRNGQYTFWGYEQMAYNANVTGDAKSFIDVLAASRIAPQTTGTCEISGVAINSMKCTRSDIGTLVTPL